MGVGTGWSTRTRAAGAGLVAATVAALVGDMLAKGAVLDRRSLAVSWQLVDLPVLRDDPIGSLWYLHTQPPLFNVVVGAVLRWSPAPPVGTLFVLYGACLLATGLLLGDLLGRWGVHPVLAGGIAALALTTPSALRTIVIGSYEVPLATLVTLALWLTQRHLTRPRAATFVALSAALTAIVMVRSLFHPLWLVAVLALVAVARPVSRRALLVAAAVPLLVVGGWMAKNQALFGDPTLSSWLGFNLQRGVVAPLAADAVAGAVAAGAVTPLATVDPWLPLDAYEALPGTAGTAERRGAGACAADHRHPALSARWKTEMRIANFNHACYLPLYRESQANAVALVRRDPGAYLRTRGPALLLAFRADHLGREDPPVTFAGPREPHRTWMDAVGSVVLLPVDATIDMRDWNLPLLGFEEFPIEVSVTLVAGFLVVGGRAALALVRLVRAGWRDRAEAWAPADVTWLVLGSVALLLVVGASLVEFGENDRFRATIDPLLLAGPLALAGRGATARWAGRGEPGPAGPSPAAAPS